jgi:2-dehydro-3-deoxyphosphooctonate aldolase (KDO 8-P synthase)
VFSVRRQAEACPTIVQACSISKNLNDIRRMRKKLRGIMIVNRPGRWSVTEQADYQSAAGCQPAPHGSWAISAGLVRNAMPIRFDDFTNRAQLVLIAGPCVIESEEHVNRMADAIGVIASEAGFPYVFKASFDKANRTSLKGFRGPGPGEGLQILGRLRARGFSVLTDIHEPAQAAPAAETADILQIPAFLCRQTDLLLEAGRTGRVVNVKKGQFVSPQDIHHAADKVASTGNSQVVLTERGSSFGYNNLVVDMRGLRIMADAGWPVVFDATHSVQLPSSAGGVSGGQPEFIEPLAAAAVATGISGIFVEVHDEPEKALSDGANALRLSLLPRFLRKLRLIDEARRAGESA